MSKFADKMNRVWTLDLTIGSADQVEQDTGVDLLKWVEGKGVEADNRLLFRVVGSLCAEQIAERGMDARTFARGFDGPALERAGDALMEALLFFSQPSRVAWASLPKMRQAVAEAHERAARAIEARGFSASPGNSPESPASTPGP